MSGHRTTARAVPFLLLLWALTGTAQAGEPPDRIVFPVVGRSSFTDDFGAARAQGGHQGNDIIAPRRARAVAAEAGRVKFHTTSWRAGCMLYLYGRSGTTYLYIHLNNDFTRRNDNRGRCVPGVAYARGLRSGQRVRAGQLVGYVGDSGDANGVHPHLHFELHPHGRGAVSPYRWLRRARYVIFAVPAARKQVSLKLRGWARSVVPGSLEMAARRVRLGNWSARIRRPVALEVAPAAVIERAVDEGVLRPASLAALREGKRIAVRTARFRPTLRTQLARPRALVGERVVVLPGSR